MEKQIMDRLLEIEKMQEDALFGPLAGEGIEERERQLREARAEEKKILTALSDRDKLDYLFSVFERHQKELYLVGGAVRDMVSGRTPHDYDLATDAKAEEIASMFSSVNTPGLRYGTSIVVLGETPFEITTYRKDTLYADGRRPEAVIFSENMRDDLIRRDFTINALYMDRNGAVLDASGGMRDLKDGVIRCVGLAKERFKEDRLRLWRALRMASERGFRLDTRVREAISENPDTDEISIERIRDEFSRMLMGEHPGWGGYLSVVTGAYPSLLRRLCGKVKAEEEVLTQGFERAEKLPANLPLRLVAATRFMDEVSFENFITGMKYPNRLLDEMRAYRAYFPVTVDSGIIPFKRMLADIGLDAYTDLSYLQERIGKEEDDLELVSAAQRGRFRAREIFLNDEPLHLPQLAMTGSAVRKHGFKGQEIGEALSYLLYLVYEEPSLNTREQLTPLLLELKESHDKEKEERRDLPVQGGSGETRAEAHESDGDQGDSGSE